jgi:polyhydroxybutyrate depolymerase
MRGNRQGPRAAQNEHHCQIADPRVCKRRFEPLTAPVTGHDRLTLSYQEKLMRHLTTSFLLIVLLPAAAFAQFLEPGDHHVKISTPDGDRPYLVHIPKGDSSAPMPLVMMLHGAGGNAENAARAYGWPEKADVEHFVVVFPQGTPPFPNLPANLLTNPNLWNDHRPNMKLHTVDDVAYLSAVLDDCQRRANIDLKRIYVTGFSNGASMTFHLATQLSSRIAAIAPVSGHCFLDDAKLAHPIPLMLTVGDSDPLNPLNGGLAKNPWGAPTTKPAMIDSVNDWLRFNHAQDTDPKSETHGSVTTQSYADNSIIFVTVKGQGHEWPGHRRTLPRAMTGPTNMSYDATTAIWDFFKDKSLGSHP